MSDHQPKAVILHWKHSGIVDKQVNVIFCGIKNERTRVLLVRQQVGDQPVDKLIPIEALHYWEVIW